MKRILCALAALLLISLSALAETSVIENPEIIIEMITPSPSPEPVGETFSSEDLIVTLPAGLSILTDAARAGYDAAVSFDYPSAGSALLLAAGGDAALSFSILETDLPAAEAARDAALQIPDSTSVEEITLGENHFSRLDCELEGSPYQLHFLSDGARLLCVGASGLEEEAIHAMLTGLIF